MPHFEPLKYKYIVHGCLCYSNRGHIRGQKLGGNKTKVVWNYSENVKLFTCQKHLILIKCFGPYKHTCYGSLYLTVAMLEPQPNFFNENLRIKNLLLNIKLHYISE